MSIRAGFQPETIEPVQRIPGRNDGVFHGHAQTSGQTFEALLFRGEGFVPDIHAQGAKKHQHTGESSQRDTPK